MHTAEVLQMALHSAKLKPSKHRPIESGHTQPKAGYPVGTALAAAGVLSAGFLYLRSRREQKTDSPNPNGPKPDTPGPNA